MRRFYVGPRHFHRRWPKHCFVQFSSHVSQAQPRKTTRRQKKTKSERQITLQLEIVGARSLTHSLSLSLSLSLILSLSLSALFSLSLSLSLSLFVCVCVCVCVSVRSGAELQTRGRYRLFEMLSAQAGAMEQLRPTPRKQFRPRTERATRPWIQKVVLITGRDEYPRTMCARSLCRACLFNLRWCVREQDKA